MFKKILLPTDGSRHSEEAARVAGQMSAVHQAAVIPIVTVEFRYLSGVDIGDEISRTIADRIRARAQEALQEAAAAVTSHGGKVLDGEILEGPPADVIVRHAREQQFDLIVIASQGISDESGYDRIMGSVTERVLHEAPCPVLVIRAHAQP